MDLLPEVEGVGKTADGCTVDITQEQADDILDGEPEHCETYSGRPVKALFILFVYVAQKLVIAEA